MAEEAESSKERNEVVSADPDRKTGKSSRSSSRRPPLNYLAIIKDAVVPVETSSLERLYDQLYEGVVLQQGKRKYWVHRELNKNCFMLFPRELAITWGDTEQYWGWTTEKESGGVDVEVAELKNVCWLEISGKFRTIALSAKTRYEIALVVWMREGARGWQVPVKIDLTLPDGSKSERTESLLHMPRGEWDRIVIGEFTTSPDNIGEITFCIQEPGAHWKTGLRVKGVSFEPKGLS